MMRSKSKNHEELEADKNLDKVGYLSGAYIRSFVKQLASSRTQHSSSKMRERDNLEREDVPDPPGNHPPPHKKQVRRRPHTRKPYQEKLLNMAEARREIVSALKLHRAAMKQAAEKQESGPGIQLSRPASNYHPCDEFPVNYSDNSCFYYSPGFCPPYSWSAPSFAPPPPDFQENLDFVLPNRPLGLNLNLQDFITTPSPIYSSSSPSTSSSPPPSAAMEEIPSKGTPTPAAVEQDQIERIELTRSIEIRGEEEKYEEFVGSPFDELMEFPTWLNANESWLQQVNDFCNSQDPALPCIEIEEIEGMDGDWLA